MKIQDLTKNPENPRTITEAKRKMLLKALRKFGDLSGIVFNRKTKRLVGGHQRRDIFDPSTPIVISKTYSKPTKTGTVAEGYFEARGERFAYREVFWDEHTEKAANLAANKGAGEWDPARLKDWIVGLNSFDVDFDMDLTMFDALEMKDILGVEVRGHLRTLAQEVAEAEADEEENEEDVLPERIVPRSKLNEVYEVANGRLFVGDSNISLKKLENDSIDSIVTDGPYELGFMGKEWDKTGIVNRPDFWKEVLRVLKPGGHLLSFGGTRTYHRMVVAIEDAGFEIRDQIQWLYGSGFPKSHNLDGDWEGWGTTLKPANEPIVLARKPLEKGLTVAQNVLKWGTGALNIDASRIEGRFESGWSKSGSKESENTAMSGKNYSREPKPDSSNGRWPANLILDETAAEMLDEQSGHLHGAGNKNLSHPKASPSFGIGDCGPRIPKITGDNGGGASRFFYCAKASKSERNAGLEGMPDVNSKTMMRGTSGSGKKNFEGGFQDHVTKNHHPTVKPLRLMEYLIRLITPPNGTVLDPFAGSGSTLVAAFKHGFSSVGMEMQTEYADIILARIEQRFQIKAQRIRTEVKRKPQAQAKAQAKSNGKSKPEATTEA